MKIVYKLTPWSGVEHYVMFGDGPTTNRGVGRFATRRELVEWAYRDSGERGVPYHRHLGALRGHDARFANIEAPE